MKNIVSFNNIVKCNICNINGFFCYSSQNEGFVTCPLCQNDDYMNDLYESSEDIYNKYFTKENLQDTPIEIYKKYLFCGRCRIIYNLGCIHSHNKKITSNCYNGHLVGKWKYKDEIYIGMPQFDTIEEWYTELKNIEILEWICPNDGFHCAKIEFDDQYTDCELKKKLN